MLSKWGFMVINDQLGKNIIEVFDYDKDTFKELNFDESTFDLLPIAEKNMVRWININGLHNSDIIKKIGKTYNIHSLVLEDIQGTDERPKIVDYDKYVYIVVKMLFYKNEELIKEQVSIILGKSS